LINSKPKGDESSTSIVHIISNDSLLDSNLWFKNANQLHTLHRENDFHHTCQFFQRFSLMDSYQFIPLFIQMFKYNINTPFTSYKHLWLQIDGDFVVPQQMKIKHLLGYYDIDSSKHSCEDLIVIHQEDQTFRQLH